MIFLIITAGAVAVLLSATLAVLRRPTFGATPAGERLERMRRSPNYHDSQFHNRVPTPLMTDTAGSGFVANLWDFVTGDRSDLAPAEPLKMMKRNLKNLSDKGDYYVWFGHSSYLLSLHGLTLLADPTLVAAAPVRFVNRPFPGTDRYAPEDLPDHIDYLIITHDHYDHLDYETVRRLRHRVKKVVCPLGVGAHFERWGFRLSQLIELDWDETAGGPGGVRIHCLTARHFSGRSLARNPTLWASFLVETPRGSIFIGGDSGYGPHFSEIGRRFPKIDLAILENGQYDRRWAHIHTLPEELPRVVADLGARQVLTVHHSKYALAHHAWDEPLRNEQRLQEAGGCSLLVAPLGEIVPLRLH